MLKPTEIKALSNKLNTDINTIEDSLRGLLSIRGTIIDNEVMREEHVLEFLRICIKAKNKKERDRLFYSDFLPKFAKLESRTKTIVYFLRDYFFCAVLTYLEALERRNFGKKFDPIWIDTFDTFIFPVNIKYLNPIKMRNKKGFIVDTILSRILDEISLSELGITDEDDYLLTLSIEILEQVGFLSLVSDKIRFSLVGLEEYGNEEELKNARDALSAKKRESRDKYIFLYCLCEVLRAQGYGAEKSYELVAELLVMPSTTVRTRYFEQKKKFKDTSTQNLIQTHNIQYDIGFAVEEILKLS